jgi:hypothetical protein
MLFSRWQVGSVSFLQDFSPDVLCLPRTLLQGALLEVVCCLVFLSILVSWPSHVGKFSSRNQVTFLARGVVVTNILWDIHFVIFKQALHALRSLQNSLGTSYPHEVGCFPF